VARKPTDQVQLKLRFDERLRRKLEHEAIRNNRSLNSEIVARLEHDMQRLGLLEEVLTLAYGERWAAFFVAAHKNGILRVRTPDRAAMKAIAHKFIDDCIDKIPEKTGP
jgi:hypothetical protein